MEIMSGQNPDNLLKSTIVSTSSTSASILKSPTQSSLMASIPPEISKASTILIGDPLSHVGDGIFLQTKTAQGLAGICVWVALFITCQQVNITKMKFFF